MQYEYCSYISLSANPVVALSFGNNYLKQGRTNICASYLVEITRRRQMPYIDCNANEILGVICSLRKQLVSDMVLVHLIILSKRY